MNAACSAGTGSFLEESARGDLGLAVTDIARLALAAAAPVQFKATCAAFINSDIRTALQEGHSRDDIVAGLVYSIVKNYLTSVKGPPGGGSEGVSSGRCGLEPGGGTCLRPLLDKPFVDSPASGTAGSDRCGTAGHAKVAQCGQRSQNLASLANPAMRRLGQFSCQACDNQCTIDRFEVARRRFPFGGRCSLYENLRKTKGRSGKDVVDLVGKRNELLFAATKCAGDEGESVLRVGCSPVASSRRVGIPRALTTHSLYPLYATFLRRLGMDGVLSGIDPAGCWKANSAFCFPVQIAHGAVSDLIRQGVDTVFLPHVNRMPNPNAHPDSFLCPVTQSSPYFVSKVFPAAQFVSPLLNFAEGYQNCHGLIDAASCHWGSPRATAEQAYQEAVRVQLETERSMQSSDGKP